MSHAYQQYKQRFGPKNHTFLGSGGLYFLSLFFYHPVASSLLVNQFTTIGTIIIHFNCVCCQWTILWNKLKFISYLTYSKFKPHSNFKSHLGDISVQGSTILTQFSPLYCFVLSELQCSNIENIKSFPNLE